MKKNIVRAVALASLVGFALSACAAGPGPDVEERESLPAVTIEGFEDVAAILDYEHAVASLPVDRYSLNSPNYVVTVLHAIASLTDACMVERGQPAVSGEYDWSPFQQSEDRLYGLWSVSYASQYGTSLAAEAGPPVISTVDRGVAFNEDYDACRVEATDELLPELTFSQEMNIDAEIRSRANDLTLASAEGKAAKQAWQDCMEGEGIVLEKLDGRPSVQYQKQGKESEIKAAVVEAQCAHDSGAIQELYDIHARYEAALLESQSAQVQEFSQRRDDALKVFEAAIAG